MLGAIELYNKPRITYRDEICVVLVVNAWELALKAVLRKRQQSVFYKKERNQGYRSITLDDALKRISNRKYWGSLDGKAIAANIETLQEYRNNAIHLYNSGDLSTIIYQLMQQSIINYRDLVVEAFNKDLADEISWQLLPLGISVPPDSIEFLRKGVPKRGVKDVQEFMDHLRQRFQVVDTVGGDTGRVITGYDIHLRSVKRFGTHDLVVGVDQDAKGNLIFKDRRTADTHPYAMTQLLKRVNDLRPKGSRAITSHDFIRVCDRDKLRQNSQFAEKHPNHPSFDWSEKAVQYFVELPEASYQAARALRKS